MFKKTLFSFLILFYLFISGFYVLNYLFPLQKELLVKEPSTRLFDEEKKLLRAKLSSDGYWRFHVNSNELPALLKESVIVFEDRFFYSHFGFNPFSMLRALWHNAQNKRVIGASTISMQVARMMQPKKRNLKAKFIELFRALQLEYHFSKEQILQAYFNLAPYGGNIEGVKTAAWFYFQKPLSQLSISEVALLTTIPKNPNSNRLDKITNLEQKRLRVLTALLKEKLITKEQFLRAKKEPLKQKRFHVPMHAPHFSNLAQFQKRADVFTSLNLGMQLHAKKLLAQHVKRLASKGVSNGALVLIHNPSMQIKVYLGSQDFFGLEGQNDGVLMLRSPGSALKPFIYAKAFDAGLTTPAQKLFDVPLHLQGYKPQNFDKHYMGAISSKEALQNSLNIPAIELNQLLGKDSLYELLRQANIRGFTKEKEYYGASVALGGFGISLLELSKLFSAFAHEGVVKSLVFEKGLQSKPLQKLFSKEAAFLTTDILAGATRAEYAAYWESNPNKMRIAFKTGTSAKARDLLTLAYTPEYTLGVWLGNFKGTPTSTTGIQSASKVAFELLEAFSKTSTWFEVPKGVSKQTQCVDALPTRECKESVSDYVITNKTLKSPCKRLRAEVLAFLLQNKSLSQKELEQARCYEQWKEYKPLLVSPEQGVEYVMAKEVPKAFQKLKLHCYSFKTDAKLTWLIDGVIQKGVSNVPLYKSFKQGRHEVACIDSDARASQAHFNTKEE